MAPETSLFEIPKQIEVKGNLQLYDKFVKRLQ